MCLRSERWGIGYVLLGHVVVRLTLTLETMSFHRHRIKTSDREPIYLWYWKSSWYIKNIHVGKLIYPNLNLIFQKYNVVPRKLSFFIELKKYTHPYFLPRFLTPWRVGSEETSSQGISFSEVNFFITLTNFELIPRWILSIKEKSTEFQL